MGTKLCVRKASERGLLWEERIGLLKYGCPSVFLITTYCAGRSLPNAGQIFKYDRDWHGLALVPQAMGGKDLFVRPAGKVVGVGVSGKRGSGSVALTSATRCRRPRDRDLGCRSATWNCLLPKRGAAPGSGCTWSVRQPTREFSKCQTSSLSTEGNDDIEEIHPVGDTHGGLPWMTIMKIPTPHAASASSDPVAMDRRKSTVTTSAANGQRAAIEPDLDGNPEQTWRASRTRNLRLPSTRAPGNFSWPWLAMAIVRLVRIADDNLDVDWRAVRGFLQRIDQLDEVTSG